MSILSRIFHFGRILTSSPNAPFLHGPQLNMILGFLSDMGITQKTKSDDFSRGGYAIDDFCLYVRFRRGNASYPLLIDAHLDHPGFVLDGKGQAIAFGSVGFNRIKDLLKNKPIDLRIFKNSGEFITLGKITDLQLTRKPTVHVETPIPVPANSHGIWNVTDFEVNNDKIFMQSADATAVVLVVLALIEQITLFPENFPDLDVTFVFTFLEEVFEISASALAMKRHTPFGIIDEHWRIIVLECMESVPLASQDQLVSSRNLMGQNLRNLRLTDDDRAYSSEYRDTLSSFENVHCLYKSLNLPLPNHDDGVAIKINDTDCIYGYEFPDQPNFAEALLLSTVEELGIAYQHTLYGGACNGTAYSLFPTSSHIATLNVPNPYKHNLGPDGSIVAEQVKVADIESTARILVRILESANRSTAQVHPRSISQYLKSTSLVPVPQSATRLRAERGSSAWSAQWRLMNKRYFGENLGENLAFCLRGGMARIRQFGIRFLELV